VPHVLIAGKMHPSGIALIEAAADVTYTYVEGVTEAEYLPHLAAAEGLVIRTQPLRAEAIAGAAHLRVVSRHGVGYDAVDLAALNARGIPLAIVGDANSRAVAEHAMALMLAAEKEIVAGDRAVKGGDWARRNAYGGRELGGRRLLIVGYGRSGRRLARIAAGFGMSVEAFDPYLGVGAMAGEPARLAGDLAAALGEADFVSVHAPKGPRPVLGAAEIAAMRPGAILVNTARGGVVDERALLAGLDEGRIAAAGLDVFVDEPPEAGDALAMHPRVVATPHVAGLSRESMERLAIVSVRNVLDFFEGRLDPALVVNGAALASGRGP
jgi:D-3-phosphoglycerate dehydrogenase / 2-oxoglutarate reductase